MLAMWADTNLIITPDVCEEILFKEHPSSYIDVYTSPDMIRANTHPRLTRTCLQTHKQIARHTHIYTHINQTPTLAHPKAYTSILWL